MSELLAADTTQAYLQAASKMLRRIFTKPQNLELGRDEFLESLLPLYAIRESGDSIPVSYWANTLSDFLVKQSNLSNPSAEIPFFFRKVGKMLEAIITSSIFTHDVWNIC